VLRFTNFIRITIAELLVFFRKFSTHERFPRPARNERGGGQGEGRLEKCLLSPALSSIGMEEREWLGRQPRQVHPWLKNLICIHYQLTTKN
jgi:hypothetical protein